MRCLRGAVMSAVSQATMVDRCGLRAGATRSLGRRGGGGAAAMAWRTVRRWTLWRRARSRLETSSSRRARRIRSNSSTLDTPAPLLVLAYADQSSLGMNSVGGGAKSACHTHPAGMRTPLHHAAVLGFVPLVEPDRRPVSHLRAPHFSLCRGGIEPALEVMFGYLTG